MRSISRLYAFIASLEHKSISMYKAASVDIIFMLESNLMAELYKDQEKVRRKLVQDASITLRLSTVLN